MAANDFKCLLKRGARIVKTHGIMLLLLVDIFFSSVNGYLSSANVEPQYKPPSPDMNGPAVSTPTLDSTGVTENYTAKCPSGDQCSKLPADCFTCDYHHNCTYGKRATFTCKTKTGVHCVDDLNQPQVNFNLSVVCQFCWQLDPSEYRCNISTTCMTVSCPRKRYNTTCKVLDHVNCLGRREFQKRLFCNWTGGYKWSMALTLSITLGGFGADRFYLGQWREGLGKLFSFGGLGIWTLIDVLLIAVGYVGPADGSLYI